MLKSGYKLASDLLVETKTYSSPTLEIQWLYEQVSKNSTNKRRENYTLEKSFTEHTLCYSMTTVNNIPVLGSVAWNRPFYNGAVRILTRYCINPEYITYEFGKRTEGWKNGIRIDVVDHIDQQVSYLQSKGYSNFFISREDKTKDGRRTKQILEQINKHSKTGWNISNNKELVCPDPVSNHCWQWIIYNNNTLDIIKGLTKNEN